MAPEPAAADEPAAAQPAAPLEQAAAAAPVEQAAAVAAAPAPEAVAVAAAPSSATVRLSVAVHCRTCVGQDVVLVGGSASLGSWDATQGLVLTWTGACSGAEGGWRDTGGTTTKKGFARRACMPALPVCARTRRC